jgi:hypothetical protein
MNGQRKDGLKSSLQFWLNVYWIAVIAVYVIWRAVIFLKKIQ